MPETTIPLPSAYTGKPMFLVGVTGYMKPEPNDVDTIREQVRNVLLFLRDGGEAPIPPSPRDETASAPSTTSAETETLADWLARRLAPQDGKPSLFKFYRHALQQWSPLKNTPIVVMSALAPGVDSFVADEALKLGLGVIAPLPFPAKLYRNSSSFVWNDATDAENMKRQETFDDLRERILPENVFPVPLAADLTLSPEVLSKLIVDDLTATNVDGTPRRHERYYAAGECIASYSHLMLAVWDGRHEESKVGTSAIVLTRMQGPRPGILSTTNDLALPNGGPLLHLYARKATKLSATGTSGASGIGARPNSASFPAMRLLHPFSAAASGQSDQTSVGNVIAPRQHADRELQRARLSTFVRIASNLKRFNSQSIPPWMQRNRDEEFQTKRLVQGVQREMKKAEVLPTENTLWTTGLLRGLRRISDLRCEAGDANAWFTEWASWTMRWLFLSTLVAAMMLHVFAHWHPRGDAPGSHADHAVSTLRTLAGMAAFVFGSFGLVIFVIAKSLCIGEQRDDTRALGEGLRVQFYWNLAGLGRSVSANYMQRQRSELDWIRGVIRAASIPYHWWTDQFTGLSPSQQLDALRCVHGGWIQEQQKYFNDAYHKRQHSLHGWHNLGFVVTLAGLFSMAAWWVVDWSTAAHHWLDAHHGQLVSGAMMLLGIAGIRSLVMCCTKMLNDAQDQTDSESPTPQHSQRESSAKKKWSKILYDYFMPKWPRGRRSEVPQFEPRYWYVWRCLRHWRALTLNCLMKLVKVFTPASGSSPPPASSSRSLFFRSLRHFFMALLPMSLAAALLTVSAVYAAAETFRTGPKPENLGIIAGGILLLFGALSIAWVEKNFDSELSYQYNTMARLFQHADQWMARLLAELERKLKAATEGSPPEQRVAQAEFNRVVRDTQRFLYEVGVEALDENAEWLILHRARPLEPVMAG